MSTEAKAGEEKRYTGPLISYALNDGKITRSDKDGETVVAHYDGKTLSLIPQWSKFRAPVVRWLNLEQHTVETVVLVGDEEKAAAVKEDAIPPKPKKDMASGDKTPALVEWYRKYKPAEYKARYGIKGPGTVTKYRKELNADGEAVSVAYEVEAILAERKTHLTEKIEAGNATDSEYNDK